MATFNDAGLQLLKKLEGCRLTAYVDQAGVWTIGYGHTGHEVVPGLCWTQSHADAALQDDVEQFSGSVDNLVETDLNDNQFSALVIFAYNIGLAAFSASTALRHVNADDFASVPPAMMLWDKIHDPTSHQLVVSPGLVARRQAEIKLWNTPADVPVA
jgi:lysozyme